jgi:hypothetical protein
MRKPLGESIIVSRSLARRGRGGCKNWRRQNSLFRTPC